MNLKKFSLFKFNYRRPNETEYISQYIIAEHFPDAFNKLYIDNGDAVEVYSCEVIAKEGVDLSIVPEYVLSRLPEKGEVKVIQGMQDYQYNNN